MKKIKDNDTLKAAVQELYEASREAMLNMDGQWRQLQISYAHICKIAKMNGIEVDPLPIPKSIVQGAPQLITPASQKEKQVPPSAPVSGDVLADNLGRPKRKTKK